MRGDAVFGRLIFAGKNSPVPGPVKIAPSLLSADFSCLGAGIEMVEKGGAGAIHYDVMDGRFVPNLTIGPLVLEGIRKCTKLPIDVHLMVEKPEWHVPGFAKAGADWISVHVEACRDLGGTVRLIKGLGKKAGAALKPGTPLAGIDGVLRDLDFVLIMSVEPGFGGQELIAPCLEKISTLKAILKERGLGHVFVEIDGGVKLGNLKQVTDAGADVAVSGSGIFNTEDPMATVRLMKQV